MASKTDRSARDKAESAGRLRTERVNTTRKHVVARVRNEKSTSAHELVPGCMHRQEMLGLRWVALYLLPKVEDEIVHRSGRWR